MTVSGRPVIVLGGQVSISLILRTAGVGSRFFLRYRRLPNPFEMTKQDGGHPAGSLEQVLPCRPGKEGLLRVSQAKAHVRNATKTA